MDTILSNLQIVELIAVKDSPEEGRVKLTVDIDFAAELAAGKDVQINGFFIWINNLKKGEKSISTNYDPTELYAPIGSLGLPLGGLQSRIVDANGIVTESLDLTLPLANTDESHAEYIITVFLNASVDGTPVEKLIKTNPATPIKVYNPKLDNIVTVTSENHKNKKIPLLFDFAPNNDKDYYNLPPNTEITNIYIKVAGTDAATEDHKYIHFNPKTISKSELDVNKYVVDESNGFDLKNDNEYEITLQYDISGTVVANAVFSLQNFPEMAEPMYAVPANQPDKPRAFNVMRPDGSQKASADDSAIQLFWQAPLNDEANIPSEVPEKTTVERYDIQYAVSKNEPQSDNDWTDLSGSTITAKVVTTANDPVLFSGGLETLNTEADDGNSYKNNNTPRDAVYSVVLSGFEQGKTVWTRVRAVNYKDDLHIAGEYCAPKKAVIYKYTGLTSVEWDGFTKEQDTKVHFRLDISKCGLTLFKSSDVSSNDISSNGLFDIVASVDVSKNGVKTPSQFPVGFDNLDANEDQRPRKKDFVANVNNLGDKVAFSNIKLAIKHKKIIVLQTAENDEFIKESEDMSDLISLSANDEELTTYNSINTSVLVGFYAEGREGENNNELDITVTFPSLPDLAVSNEMWDISNIKFKQLKGQGGDDDLEINLQYKETQDTGMQTIASVPWSDISANEFATVDLVLSYTHMENTIPKYDEEGEVKTDFETLSFDAAKANAKVYSAKISVTDANGGSVTIDESKIQVNSDATLTATAGQSLTLSNYSNTTDDSGLTKSNKFERKYKCEFFEYNINNQLESIITKHEASADVQGIGGGTESDVGYKVTITPGYSKKNSVGGNSFVANVDGSKNRFAADIGSITASASWSSTEKTSAIYGSADGDPALVPAAPSVMHTFKVEYFNEYTNDGQFGLEMVEQNDSDNYSQDKLNGEVPVLNAGEGNAQTTVRLTDATNISKTVGPNGPGTASKQSGTPYIRSIQVEADNKIRVQVLNNNEKIKSAYIVAIGQDAVELFSKNIPDGESEDLDATIQGGFEAKTANASRNDAGCLTNLTATPDASLIPSVDNVIVIISTQKGTKHAVEDTFDHNKYVLDPIETSAQ